MRQKTISFSLAAAWLAMLSACKKDEPAAQPAVQLTESNAPAQALQLQTTLTETNPVQAPAGVVLKMLWPAGSRSIYRMELDQHSTNNLPQPAGATREDLALAVTYGLSVVAPNEAGRTELELEFLATEMEIKFGEQVVVSFASPPHAQGGAQTQVPAPFQKLINSKLRLQLDEQGRVERVLGHGEWLQSVAGDQSTPPEQMLAQQFNEGFLQQIADFGRGLSPQPVRLGESWPYRTELPAGAMGKILVDSTITLKDWADHEGRKLAVLGLRGTLKGKAREGDSARATLSFDRGTVTGTCWFDPELGTLIESSVEQFMRLNGEIPPSSVDQPASQFTSDIGQKVTVKLVELNRADR